MKLSVLIPAYNAEQHISRCLQSIFKQSTGFDLEVMVINDGSTDATAKVVEQFMQKYSQLQLINIPNQGVYKARNFGLKQITGDYVWMLDADDYLNEHVLLQLVKHISHSKATLDVIHLAYQQQSSDKSWQLKVPHGEHREIINGFEFLKRSDGRLFLWNNIYRTAFLNKHNIKFLAKSVSLEDSLFNINVFSKAKSVQLLKLNAYSYCYNINSISKKTSLKHLEDKGISSYNVHSQIKKIRDTYPLRSEKYNIINHRLNHSVLGFFFSLYKDGYSAAYANEMLGTYNAENLLPIHPLPSSFRLRLFAILVNAKWLYKLLKMTNKA
ncbi:MAG: glycosyltransferase [Bacteroidetes bacterium]|jgi:glycosyltransferase involved in cell wall biosynthesis|nr:glycosyltransferase [Bacteroidota bacterium]